MPRCLLAADDVNQKLAVLRERPRPRPHYSIRADEVRGEAFYQSNRPLGKKLQEQVVSAVPEGVQSVLRGMRVRDFSVGLYRAVAFGWWQLSLARLPFQHFNGRLLRRSCSKAALRITLKMLFSGWVRGPHFV